MVVLISMDSVGKLDYGFVNDTRISTGNNFGNGSGFDLTYFVAFFSRNSKGCCMF